LNPSVTLFNWVKVYKSTFLAITLSVKTEIATEGGLPFTYVPM